MVNMTSEVHHPLTWLRSLSIYLFTRRALEEKKYVTELRPTIQEDTQEKREATSYNLAGVGLKTSPG